MAAIAALIVEPRWLKPEWTLGGHKVTWYLVIIMLALTVVSAVPYFVRAYHRLGVPLLTGGGGLLDEEGEDQ
jgi:hypothetical protein